MNKIYSLIICTLILLPLISASCSLGANPLTIELSGKPGQEVIATWNLYNMYGDRITHVTLSKVQGVNWEINYDPELHEQKYDISGKTESVDEHLALMPYPAVSVIPDNPLENYIFVKHPKENSYIPAKQIKINITIPRNAELWEEYPIIFEARGSCFSEPGAVVPSVATKLKVNIRTTTEFYEAPITNQTEEETRISLTGAAIGSNIAAGILLLMSFVLTIAILYLLIKMRKNNKLKKQQVEEIKKSAKRTKKKR